MARPPRIKTKRLSYYEQGPNELGIYSGPLRTEVLKTTDGRDVRPARVLEELVNLPDDPKSSEIGTFIGRYGNLIIGGVDDSRSGVVEQMRPSDVVGLRGKYRQFWTGGINKSRLFLEMLQSQQISKRARTISGIKQLKNGSLEGSDEQLSALMARGTPFPYLQLGRSALRLDWRTGRFTFCERVKMDRLTFTVFENRDRLRECRYPGCDEATAGGKKLFIAAKSNEFFCCSQCRSVSDRERKKQSARNRRTRLRIDGLTSRKTKPKRKNPIRG
jgi:hypothetical protein